MKNLKNLSDLKNLLNQIVSEREDGVKGLLLYRFCKQADQQSYNRRQHKTQEE